MQVAGACFCALMKILCFFQVVVSTLAFTSFELPPNDAVGTRILMSLFNSRPDLVRKSAPVIFVPLFPIYCYCCFTNPLLFFSRFFLCIIVV